MGFSTRFENASLTASKFAMHILVVVRSRMTRTAQNYTTMSSVLYKTGYLLPISDLLLIIFICLPLADIKVYIENQECHEHIPRVIHIWWVINDIFIGGFCLTAFVMPLLALIKMERAALVQESRFLPIVIKTVLLTSLALVSTIIITVLAMIYIHVGDALFEIDSVINSLCVVMLFVQCNGCRKKKTEPIATTTSTRPPNTYRQQMELAICEQKPAPTNDVKTEVMKEEV